jgi:hypothetical protein
MTPEEHRRGSAAVALQRLSHPGRDGRESAAIIENDQISEVTRRLSELLAVAAQQTPEDRGAALGSTESGAPALARSIPDDDTGTAMITLRVDTQVLARIDAAAKRLGISRTAWLHLAAEGLLGDRR